MVGGLTFIRAWDVSSPPVSGSSFITNTNYGQVAVDSSGNIYVAGANVSGKGVAKYNSSGTFLTSFGPLDAPGVTVDRDGNILVTDWNANIGTVPGVQKFNSSGTPIDISATDLGSAMFSFSYGIASDSQGNVYVSDIQGNGDADVVYKFNSSGALVATITGNGTSFDQPQAVAVDGSDNLYVLDSNRNRVQKFNSGGTFQLEITDGVQAMSYPEGFTVDSTGNVYVSDSGNNKIKIFNTAGTLSQSLVPADFGLGSFNYLVGLAITPGGILYVGNYGDILKAVFDRQAPSVSITSFPSDTTSDSTPDITGSTTDLLSNITSVEYSMDSGTYTACTSSDGTFNALTENYTCSIGISLSDGSHTVTVRATDSYTNTTSGGDIATYTFTVSTASPTSTPTPTPTGTITPTPTTTGTPSPTPTQAPTGNNNSNNSSNPINSTPVCGDGRPLYAPDLFEVRTTKNTVKLFFTPLPDTNNYFISFSTSPIAEENGEQVSLLREGVQSHEVYMLKPSTTYYFKVRGQNGCMPGPWSNVLKLVTNNKTVYKYGPTLSSIRSKIIALPN
jgi:hypothetical protein